jgi:hypothetical protein
MALSIKHLKNIIKNVDDDFIVVTENIQDGINRHNEIIGYENDKDDEYFVIKIDNQAEIKAQEFADSVINHFQSLPILNEAEEALLNYAYKVKDGEV